VHSPFCCRDVQVSLNKLATKNANKTWNADWDYTFSGEDLPDGYRVSKVNITIYNEPLPAGEDD
jgi:hypothetical protein